jgi:hypothetical protein
LQHERHAINNGSCVMFNPPTTGKTKQSSGKGGAHWITSLFWRLLVRIYWLGASASTAAAAPTTNPIPKAADWRVFPVCCHLHSPSPAHQMIPMCGGQS